MKVCPRCNTECRNDAVFCHKCGYVLDQSMEKDKIDEKTEDQGVSREITPAPVINSGNGGNRTSNIPNRNIALCVVLSIVTCGIYGIYWMIMLNDEINEAAEDYDALSGGLVFLLSIVTCGIYSIYWAYRMGQKVDKIDETSNGNSAILYLVLSVLGLGIINFCFMQDALNGLHGKN